MKLTVYVLASLFALDVAPRCGGRRGAPVHPDTVPPPIATPTPPPLPKGPLGEVSGRVTFVGTPPAMPEQKRAVDPFCSKNPSKDDEVVVAASGGALKNVLVHVIGAPATPPPADKATIDQRDCRYVPRILPVVAGQPVAIRNGDPTLHNVHGYQGTTTEFNEAQVPESPNLDKRFADAGPDGTMHKLKCDIHQWMTGYIWVQRNGWFAVTGDDGRFVIKGIPVGTYQLEAWHERFDKKIAELTVAEGKPATIDFTYTEADNTKQR